MRGRGSFKIVSFLSPLFLLVVLIGYSTSSFGLNRLSGFYFNKKGGDSSTLEFSFSERPSYMIYSLSSPERLIIDIDNTSIGEFKLPQNLTLSPLIEDIKVVERKIKGDKLTRVILMLKRRVGYRARVLDDNRLVVEIYPEVKTENRDSFGQSISAEIERAKAKIKDLEKLLDYHKRVEESLRSQLAALLSEKEEVKNKLNMIEIEKGKALEEVERLKRELNQYKFLVEEREKTVKEAQSKITLLEGRLLQLNEKLAKTIKEKELKEKELSSYMGRLKELEDKISKEKEKKIINELSEEKKRLQSSIERLKLELEKLKESSQKNYEERDSLVKEREALKGKLEFIVREKEKLTKELEQQKTSFIEAVKKIKEYEKAKLEGEVRLKESLKQKELLEKRLNDVLKEKENAQLKAMEAESRIRELENKILEWKSKWEETKGKVDNLETILEGKEKLVIELQTNLQNVKGELEKTQREIEYYKGLVGEKSKLLEEAVSSREKLYVELERIKKELEERMKEKGDDDSKKRVEILKREKEGLEGKIKEREEEIERLRAKLEDSNKKLEELEKEKENYKKALSEVEIRERGAKDELSNLKKEYEELLKKLRAVEEERDKVLEKLSLVERYYKEAQKNLVELNKNKVKELEREITVWKGEWEKAKGLEGKIKEREEEIEKLRAKLEDSNKKLEELEKEKRATKASKEVTASIEKIMFDGDSDSGKVTILLNGVSQYTAMKEGDNRYILRFNNTKLHPIFEREMDVTAYDGPIASIRSYNTKDKGVVIEVIPQRKVESKVYVQDKKLVWEFKGKSKDNLKQEINSTQQQVGGVYSGREFSGLDVAGFVNTVPMAIKRGRIKEKKYTGVRINLDFREADIHNVLRLLADVGNVNIIAGDDVKGTVTVKMKNVPWDQALEVILQSKGLGMVREGNVIRVAPLEVLEKEREMAIAKEQQKIKLAPLETRIIPVSYASAKELSGKVTDLLSDRGKVSVDDRTNVLIVRDISERLDQIEELVRTLDTQTPQILIEARIIEASSNFKREIGIQWGGDFLSSTATGNPTGLAFPSNIGVAGGAMDTNTPTGGIVYSTPNFAVNLPATVGTGQGGALGITLGSINNNAHLNLRLSAMEETGTIKIISSPRILTMDNREAHIEQGTLIPYSQISAQGVQTAFQEAKLNLTVTPHANVDGSIVLKLKITRDEPDFVHTGARGDPTILKREAETELLVQDGHTVVIGGIFTRNAGLSYSQVPWLSKIPILGWLFKKRTEEDRRTEMLIFITPRIVNRAEALGR